MEVTKRNKCLSRRIKYAKVHPITDLASEQEIVNASDSDEIVPTQNVEDAQAPSDTNSLPPFYKRGPYDSKDYYFRMGFYLLILLSGIGLVFYRDITAPDIHKVAIWIGESLHLNNYMKTMHAPTPVNSRSSDHTLLDYDWIKGPSKDSSLKLMTDQDIEFVTGGSLRLVLIGHVFDVTSGSAYYEKGSGYHGFIGRDASRAFITGEFNEEGLTDDLSELDPQDYIGLADWLKFYLSHKTYKFVGYHIGRYFDDKGEETQDMIQFKKWLDAAKLESEKEGDLKKLFPTCNVEWTAEKGSTVWCSDKSGGIDRDWIGFPRKFFESPDKAARCACVHANFLADPRVKPYDGCSKTSMRCKILETDK